MLMKRRSQGRAFSSRTMQLGLLMTVVLLSAGCLHRFNAAVHARQASVSAADAAADAAAGALAKAEAAHARCRAAKAETLEKEGERWHQRQIKVEAELKTTAASLKKAQERVKELEHDAMAAEKERVRLAAAVEAQTAATRASEGEVQDLKDESIAALRAARDRADVLRRGLQGSAALIAEKVVALEQLNITLMQALYHMEPDQRTAAAHNLELLELGLSTKDKRRLQQRLEYKSADLERGLENAVLVFKASRTEHARLAEEFVNTTRKDEARMVEEREKEELIQAARAKERLSQSVVEEAEKEALAGDTEPERLLSAHDSKPRKAQVGSGKRPAAAAAKGKERERHAERPAKAPPVDPLKVAAAIRSMDLVMADGEASAGDGGEEEGEFDAGGAVGEEEEEEEEEEEGMGDLEWIGEDPNETPEARKEREEREQTRRSREKDRVDRAMQKELQRQEQAKYWKKYSQQHQKRKDKTKGEAADADKGGEEEAEQKGAEQGEGAYEAAGDEGNA